MAQLNERGHEILDETPLAMPLGFKKPESLQSQIQRLVRNELSARAASEGHETFDEADDFDIEDDDYDPRSPWELGFDQGTAPTPSRARAEIERAERRAIKSAVRRNNNAPDGDDARRAGNDGKVAPSEKGGDSKADGADGTK